MTILVIVVGLIALVVLSVAVGTSLDTATQRREWRRLAGERRARRPVRRPRAELCDDCPLRYW